MPRFSLNVLTINTHKGFTAFNRRFILPELREAVRSVSADIVCLQEVMGAHEIHPLHIENWPDTTHYEFLADTMWSDYAYGRNAGLRIDHILLSTELARRCTACVIWIIAAAFVEEFGPDRPVVMLCTTEARFERILEALALGAQEPHRLAVRARQAGARRIGPV